MRTRLLANCNYKAVFVNGKTLRFKLDRTKPFEPQLHPEIEDVAINSKCYANCPYCYVSAVKHGTNFNNVEDKIKAVYGALSLNLRPFQVAIGGAGEPTLHPNFANILKTFTELEITPNFTTNGMHIDAELLEAAKQYCGGVAVSYHSHIKTISLAAIKKFVSYDINTSVHYILGDSGSFNEFLNVYNQLDSLGIKYFVILPYKAAGRAKTVDTEQEFIKFFEHVKVNPISNLAFGALFYEFFQSHATLIDNLDLDVYEPEVFSGYRLMDDSYTILRKSSYNLNPKLGEE